MYMYNMILFPIPQGLALKENNISRYNAEFHEVSKIGFGQFGTVYKCINRLGTYVVLVHIISEHM